jgi:hypothetical protein
VPVSPRHRGLPGQLARFAGVGVASTLAYLALFVLLRDLLGAQAANLVALAATAVANTAANRRLTFGVSGRRHPAPVRGPPRRPAPARAPTHRQPTHRPGTERDLMSTRQPD